MLACYGYYYVNCLAYLIVANGMFIFYKKKVTISRIFYSAHGSMAVQAEIELTYEAKYDDRLCSRQSGNLSHISLIKYHILF